MENISNYIIFHPERDNVKAIATVINGDNEVIYNWEGQIFVDNVNHGNEDPFVFNNPWIYSYCHASQLKRTPRKGSFLKPGSKIIFISGPDADKELLTVDTIFIIDTVLEWGIKSPMRIQDVPSKYLPIKNDMSSNLWKKHFRFPFEKENPAHKNASYSYEAKLWEENSIAQYSYLPLAENQKRVSIPFSELPPTVMNILAQKRKGKKPAEFNSESDLNEILKLIESKTSIKILRDIKFIESCDKSKKRKRKKGCGVC